jgi:tRNA-splicing ligase RtcB (3'-phosphate/5'-hydroxy nucleic acid ligase)
MQVIKKDNYRVPVFNWCPDVEEGAWAQIENLVRLPFIDYVGLMADGHSGYGMPIGGVIGCNRTVICNAVGLDIGCGVLANRTSLTELDRDAVKLIMGGIRKRIPVGFDWHKTEVHKLVEPTKSLPVVESQLRKAKLQLGTLGSGNHFCELQKGDDGRIWFMIHSGSRNLGKQVADYYNGVAKNLNAQWHSSVDPKWDLAFLPVEDKNFNLYMDEMNYAVSFAQQNRDAMADEVREAIIEVVGLENVKFDACINIAHNYAAWENHGGKNLIVHRKGATSAREGEIGIIPGSQGTSSYIVKGLGNPKSLNSCSHGAGRKMGRNQAKKNLDLAAEIKRLDDLGVVHGIRNESDLDEAAGAYKDVDQVMENQKDLVETVTKLTPLGVVKG